MVKYGLRPHTLKGELFALLSKKGSGGLKVSELAKSPEVFISVTEDKSFLVDITDSMCFFCSHRFA
jgi:hypothetical protein